MSLVLLYRTFMTLYFSFADRRPRVEPMIDLLSVEFQQNPYPFFRKLQCQAPVYWSDQIQAWLITPYNLVIACLSDSRISANRILPRMHQFPKELREQFLPLERTLSLWPLMLDKPRHTRLRSLINQAMKNSIIMRFTPLIQSIVNELLENIVMRKEVDVIADIAYPFPLNVVSNLIGVPPTCRMLLKACAVDIVNFFGCPPHLYIERATVAMRSVFSVTEVLKEIIQDRRADPQNDLISSLIIAEQCGDVLSEEEIISTCLMMVFAGFETTTNLIGNGLLTLLQHPEELQKLRQNPQLMKNAILEMLRFESPVQRLSRMALVDFELEGKKIKKGDLLFLMAAAANRDPLQFRDPDRFDITRQIGHHLAFGHSMHACPGNTLAQLEGNVLFTEFIKKFHGLTLIDRQVEWQRNLSVRSLHHLKIKMETTIENSNHDTCAWRDGEAWEARR